MTHFLDVKSNGITKPPASKNDTGLSQCWAREEWLGTKIQISRAMEQLLAWRSTPAHHLRDSTCKKMPWITTHTSPTASPDCEPTNWLSQAPPSSFTTFTQQNHWQIGGRSWSFQTTDSAMILSRKLQNFIMDFLIDFLVTYHYGKFVFHHERMDVSRASWDFQPATCLELVILPRSGGWW